MDCDREEKAQDKMLKLWIEPATNLPRELGQVIPPLCVHFFSEPRIYYVTYSPHRL